MRRICLVLVEAGSAFLLAGTMCPAVFYFVQSCTLSVKHRYALSHLREIGFETKKKTKSVCMLSVIARISCNQINTATVMCHPNYCSYIQEMFFAADKKNKMYKKKSDGIDR